MKRKGFTLIELLAVIAILAVILVISVPLVISNIDKGKQKSYDNQVALFVEGAKRYAVEYIDEIKWEAVLDDEEIIGRFDIKLQYLADQGYVDLPVINSKTGDPFDPENTIVTVYKLKNGDLNFEFEGNIRLTVGSKLQYILRTTVFGKKMIMNDVKAFDKNKNDITSSVTYTCRYKTRENGEDVYREVDCNELANENKQLGTYVINYSVKVEDKVKSSIKTVEVVEQSSPEIVIRPETDNVESVRVTIVYPNGSKNNIYSSKSVSGENYKGSFEINENQTIIANCTDKYGLKCKTAERVITNIKPTIEGMITIAADWPNATSMKLALSGVNITRGNGKIEYKCKVGTKETAWSESPTCNITGLTEGTAYTVVAYARNKDNTMDVIEKKPVTIYTAKMVKVETKTLAGTCPTNNNIAVAETDIYEAATVTGTCTEKSYTCNASLTLSSSTNLLPETTTVSCGGVTSTGVGGSITSTKTTYTCTVPSSVSVGTAACGNRAVSCTTSGVTIKSTQAVSTCISTTASCNLSSTIKSSTACGGTKTSTCNGSTITMNKTCTDTSTTQTTYYGCNVKKYVKGGCTRNVTNPAYTTWATCSRNYLSNCAKVATEACSMNRYGSGGGCGDTYNKTYNACAGMLTNQCGTAPNQTITETYDCNKLVYDASGCSNTTTTYRYTTTYQYTCTWITGYSAFYPSITLSNLVDVTKYTTTYSYSSSWVSEYTAKYAPIMLSSTKVTGYYRTYAADNIVYKREYTVTYKSVLVKPKQKVY